MHKTPEEHLTDVAEATFESLAFLVQMPEEFGEREFIPATAATVDFTGPFHGTLMITGSADMLGELATNMLGMEDAAPTGEQEADAFKELLNVICGNLLPVIAGTEAVFIVDAPRLVDVCDTPESLGGLPLWARISLLLDTGGAELALYLPAGALQSADTTA